MLTFPCLAFREKRMILSPEELFERLKEAKSLGKSCEVSLYGFSTWRNTEPVIESVIMDKIVYIGTVEKLTEIGEELFAEGHECVLFTDGEQNILIANIETSLEELHKYEREGVELLKDFTRRFTLPGFVNVKTGKEARVLKRWRH